MSIQRYEPCLEWGFAEDEPCESMCERDDGDYVLFTAHAAKVERLEAKAYETKCYCDGYMAELEKMDAEVERLMAERDALKRELDLSRVETAGAATLRLRQRRLYTALAERDAAVARAEKAEAIIYDEAMDHRSHGFCDCPLCKFADAISAPQPITVQAPEPWGGPEGEE